MNSEDKPGKEVPFEVAPIGLSKKGGRYNGQFRPEFSRLAEDRDLLVIAPFPVRYIVGVVGQRWSGKSLVLSCLREKRGFAVHTLHDLTREFAESEGIASTSRKTRQQIGDRLRAEHLSPNQEAKEGDAGYLARRLMRRLQERYSDVVRDGQQAPRVAITGFGHPGELDVFCALPQFRLLRLKASDEIRHQRGTSSGLVENDIDSFDVQASTQAERVEAVDALDLDGLPLSPWAKDCAHSVKRVLAQVDKLSAAKSGSGAAECRPESPVFEIDNGPEGRPVDVFRRIDEVVDTLDQVYRQV